MRKHYDFSKAKKNPYAKRLKQSVTIRLDQSTVAYFKDLAEEIELPYQSLINLYLRDCAAAKRRLALDWRPEPAGAA
jgi:predicted DNA binding CopG/RHH family protein